jgi:peptidyl-prolyl cis-trans isomerase C
LRGFRELARAQSLDETSKQRGGDLPYFDAAGKGFDTPDSAVDPAIAKAAFALKDVGETSRPIQVGDRFVVVRYSGVRAARDETLHEAADQIRQRLWRDRRQAAIDAHVEQLKQAQHYSVHRELIDAVKLESGPPLPPSDGLPSGFPHTPETEPPKTTRVDSEPR